jgi:hypothetical protein
VTRPVSDRRALGKVLVGFAVPALAIGLYAIWWSSMRGWFKATDAMQGVAITGVGLVLLAIGLTLLRRPKLGLGVFVGVGAACALVVWRGAGQHADLEQGYADRRVVIEQLWPACSGTPIAGAAARTEAAPRPAVMINESSTGNHYEWHTEEPWRSPSLETTQLVACFKTDKKMVDSCGYDMAGGKSMLQGVYQYVITGRIVEAKTGKQLAERTFIGSEPGTCSERVSVKKGQSLQDRTGGMPSETEQLAFVRSFVENAERN